MSDVEKPVSGVVSKDAKAVVPTKNGYSYTYTYTSLAAVIDHVNTSMGLVVNQDIQYVESLHSTCVLTRYRRNDDTDWSEWLAPVPIIYGEGRNPMQEFGKALSYARRYSIQCALGLAAEDTDANDNVKREPKPSTPDQSGEINQLLKEKGFANRAAAHEVYLNALAGTTVEKASDLTDMQAETVISYLKGLNGQAQGAETTA